MQRSRGARVLVAGEVVGSIERGLVIFLGVGQTDDASDAASLATRIPSLRIFEDHAGKSTYSLLDVRGEVLVVSQFTLYASMKGRRPSFELAMPPVRAKELYLEFIAQLRADGLPVRSGQFGADMRVIVENDGPYTLVLDSKLPRSI